MKKYIICSFVAVVALSFVSCQKEVADNTITNDGIDVTIIAGNPITKTVLGVDGTTPYWKDGDALSVTDGANSNVLFTENNIADGETSTIATFSGKVSAAGDFYAVYPHTGSVTENKGPRVTVPTEQHPTATSFDGAADIMVSKQFAVGVTTNTTIENLQFARCGAILKVVFSGKAAAQQTKLADQHPVSVSLTSSDNDLVGNVLFDYENATASIASTPSKSVTASYTTSTQYLIDGTNATYLVVVPTTLTGTINVAATTEDYEITRTLTMPTGGIELEAGKIYTFNVTLGASSITDATPAQTLPWSNDFSWHTSTSETNYTADVATLSSDEFTAGTLIYGAKEAGAIRIGNSSTPGSITSKLLNLSGAFKVTVSAKAYNAGDGSKVTVTVGEVTKTAETALSSTSSYTSYVFRFAAGAGTAKSPIVIGTDKKRAVITSVSVETDIEQVAAPTFSPAAGAVEANTTVTISTETDGATIYYTTDGTDPSTSSTSGTSVTIDAAKTIKAFAVKDGMADSDIATAVYTIVGAAESLPYSNTLINSHDGFTINDVSTGSLSSIWSDTNYGAQANAYQTTSNVESYLESPLIDLSSVEGAKLTFTHGINFFADVATAKTQATLEVRVKDGTWNAVEIPTYPSSLGNTTANAEVSLNAYAGNIIQFRFKYLATSTKPGRWQIKNVSVEEVTPPTHSITVNGESGPLTVELNGDATKTTKLTVASNYTWSVKSTAGLTTAYTYVKDSDTQITVTPATDNTSGSKKTGIGTMVLTDGTVDYTITFDQANKVSGPTTNPIVLNAETEGMPTSYGSPKAFDDAKLEGYAFKIQQIYATGGKLQWRASGNKNGTGTLYNADAMPAGIASIVIVYNSSDSNKNHTVQIGSSANPSSATSITPTISGSTYTFTCDGVSKYFVITNGSGAGYIDSITINFN